METFKKIMAAIGGVLGFIGNFPVFLLPASLKGYRTILFNALASFVVVLQTFDIVNISESICGLFNCNPTVIQAIFALIVTTANISLRNKTDTVVTKSK